MTTKGPLWVGLHIMKSQHQKTLLCGNKVKIYRSFGSSAKQNAVCNCKYAGVGAKKAGSGEKMGAMLVVEAAPSEGWSSALAACADGRLPRHLVVEAL